jgi:hypothetical protein
MRSTPLNFLILQVLALFIILSMIGCSHNEEPELKNSQNKTVIVNSIDPDSLPSSWEDIVVNRVHAGSYIQFSGTSKLPDGTVLVSKLFEDDIPLHWWPEEQEIIVNDGEWEITVTESANITASDLELLVGPDYDFYIWKRDNPATKSSFYFDLVGPPVKIE